MSLSFSDSPGARFVSRLGWRTRLAFLIAPWLREDIEKLRYARDWYKAGLEATRDV